MVDKMKVNKKMEKHPSLYDAFKLGQRVMRTYENKCGKKLKYKGIVLAIDKNGIEIYWDILDGKYKPVNMSVDFTYCSPKEIFEGNEKYSPIKKELYRD